MDIEIKALGDHGGFIRLLNKDAPSDGVCIDGMFVYTTKRTPLEPGHTKTEEYVGGGGGATKFRCASLLEMPPRSCGRKCFRANSAIKGIESLSISNCIYQMGFQGYGYRKCVFKVRTVGGISVSPPLFAVKSGCELLKTLYGLETARKEWYGSIKIHRYKR